MFFFFIVVYFILFLFFFSSSQGGGDMTIVRSRYEGRVDEWDCGAGCGIPKESFLKKHQHLLSPAEPF